jgi:hypothetical protein
MSRSFVGWRGRSAPSTSRISGLALRVLASLLLRPGPNPGADFEDIFLFLLGEACQAGKAPDLGVALETGWNVLGGVAEPRPKTFLSISLCAYRAAYKNQYD